MPSLGEEMSNQAITGIIILIQKSLSSYPLTRLDPSIQSLYKAFLLGPSILLPSPGMNHIVLSIETDGIVYSTYHALPPSALVPCLDYLDHHDSAQSK